MKTHIIFRIHGQLKDHLAADRKGKEIVYDIEGNPSVKDAVEALGVPHPEIALVVADGEPCSFDRQIRDGEHFDVYPHCGLPSKYLAVAFSLTPGGVPRFMLDVHLGRLARYLRVAGFDTLYEKQDPGDERLANIAAEQTRILLTRDAGLLKRSIVRFGYRLRTTEPRAQMKEVTDYYGLRRLFDPFSRCVDCNGLIVPVPKEAVLSRLPEGIRRDFSEIFFCKSCGKAYWKGTHYRHVKEFLARL